MPRKELRNTYNTDCWEREEACLVHPGMHTEGEGRREGLSQWAAARSHGPPFSALGTFPASEVPSLWRRIQLTTEEEGQRDTQKDSEKQIQGNRKSSTDEGKTRGEKERQENTGAES